MEFSMYVFIAVKEKKKKTTRTKKQQEIVAATQAEQILGYAQIYEQILPEINANVTDPIHITLPDGDIGTSIERGPVSFFFKYVYKAYILCLLYQCLYRIYSGMKDKLINS